MSYLKSSYKMMGALSADISPVSSPFSPDDLSGLILWLDAVDPLDTGVQPANGSSLQDWIDKSGQGNDATQPAGATQPVYTTGARNGLPVLTFSAAAPQFLTGTLSGFAANPNFSFYIVTASTTTAGNPVVFGIGTVNANYQSIGLGINGGFIAFQWGGYTETFAPANTNYNRLQITQNNSTNTTSIFVNGAVATASAGVKGALNLNTAFSLGRHSNPIATAAWNGTVAEVLLYDRVLTGAENTDVYTYLSQRWGF